ncbi:hypothetical protein [Nostoc sp.]|uniref:hypothetical protein n=1 Tax=Nostoc sp. TaxID=1180 RepID=UPI002FF6CE37
MNKNNDFSEYIHPTILRRIDKKLLLNYPKVWSIRIHYILYFTLIAIPISLLLKRIFTPWLIEAIKKNTFGYSSSPLSPIYFVGFCTVIFYIILLLFWLDYVNKYSVEREFGSSRVNPIIEAWLYWVCSALMATPFLVVFSSIISTNIVFVIYTLSINLGQAIFSFTYLTVINQIESSENNIFKDEQDLFFAAIFSLGLFILCVWLLRYLIHKITVFLMEFNTTIFLLELAVATWIMASIFIFFLIRTKKPMQQNVYSEIQSIKLFILPYIIVVSVYFFLLLITDVEEDFNSWLRGTDMLISTLLCSPCLPYIKKQYIYLITLPKD